MTDPALTLDATLKVVEILSIIGGGSIALIAGGRVAGRVQFAIGSLQEDVHKLNELVTKVALQGQRLDTHDHRLDLTERLLDDMRRGEGYVLPLPIERRVKAKE